MRPGKGLMLCVGLTFITATALSTVALGQHRFRSGGGRGNPSGLMNSPRALERVADRIGLEKKQKSEIKALLNDSQRKKIELRSQAQLARLDLREALDKEILSEKEVLTAAKKANDVRGQIQAEKLKTLVKVRKVLTPEQTEKLKEMRIKRNHIRSMRPGEFGGGQKHMGRMGMHLKAPSVPPHPPR